MAVCDWFGQAEAGEKSRAEYALNSTLKMTPNKDTDPQRKFSRNARKARPKGGKTNPKVLLVAVTKRLSFGVRHCFS